VKTSNNVDHKSSIFKFTTTRPVAILMAVIGVLVFGFISYKQLPLNLMPDISYPSLTVRTEYQGTAPQEIETVISRPIEQELGVVDNLVSISSISKAGQSDIILEFSWNSDMNKATADVREKLDQVYLPEEVKRPLILRYDPTLDPILRLGLYGERSLFYIRYIAEEGIKRMLETVEGVAAVKVKGGLEEEIRVELVEQKMTLIGIDIGMVRDRLAQENINLAGGNLKEGQTEYLVRTLNEFTSVDEIGEVVIGIFNGREIKVKDIGVVSKTNKEREIITRINGQESVEIEIYKEADANIVSVAKAVNNIVFGTPEQQVYIQSLSAKKSDTQNQNNIQASKMTSFIEYNLPTGVKIAKLSDQAIFIENAVNEVKQTAFLGGILAIFILFIFLRNLTITLIIGLSIPISVIATFAPMKIFEVTLNIMSLGGLALGIGMLVDNSIVVLESIARCREEGDNLVQATVRGVSEVGSAVFASTLTTIAVFFPIVFVEGVAGQIFGDMSLTVVFSLLASLAVALFLIPMLASRDSSKFISGVNIKNFLNHNILNFKTEKSISQLISKDAEPIGLGRKLYLLARAIILTALFAVLKIFESFGSLILTTLKFVSIPILVGIMPIFFLLSKFKILKLKLSHILIDYAENPDFFFIRFPKECWPEYLVNRSFPAFYEDLSKLMNWFRGKFSIKKIAVLVFSPFFFFFFLLKYLFFILVELIFRWIHFSLISIGIIIKSTFLILKLFFWGPSQLLFKGFNGIYNKFESLYPLILTKALENRLSLVGSVMGVFLLTVFWVGPRIGNELIPEVHQGEFNLDLTLPVGTPAEKTDEYILDIQRYISSQSLVEKVATVTGFDKKEVTDTDVGEHTAKLTISVDRSTNVKETESSLITIIREYLENYPGILAKISRPAIFSFKTPVEVEIYGYNLQALQKVAQEAEEKMGKIPGLFDVKANIQRGNPEVQILYRRAQLSRYGLNIRDIASIVRNKVRGDVATKFKEEDRKIDVLVRLREEDKESIDNLKRMVINPGEDKPLPLSAVAEVKVSEGPSEIRRIDQQRSAVISANISGRDLGSVSNDIYRELSSMDMPSDFTFDIAGQNKEMETSLKSLMFALALAIFLVYIVMASQFESLLHPFIIIFTIPFALTGVILFLYIFHIPASIVVFLGLIMLAGIVVNNAIVLVDYINQLRARGLKKVEAILTAGKVRLRPIIMTTSTTVLGLLPMALGLGEGAEIRTPMAITVIVGLITSTILTLIVIPTVYSLFARGDQ
jgi:multidrug efflux pump subunit AcrB